jgi:hypothetical protein
MMLFQINLNGDRPETLREQFVAVLEAARALDKALGAAWPHGRNYQLSVTPRGDYFADCESIRTLRAVIPAIEEWAKSAVERVDEQTRPAPGTKAGMAASVAYIRAKDEAELRDGATGQGDE